MSAKGIFKYVTAAQTTIATGQGVLRHIGVRIEEASETWTGWEDADGIKIWIDGEVTESTSISCEDLFGGSDLGFSGTSFDINTPLASDSSSNPVSGAFPNRGSAFRERDAGSVFRWYGAADVRIPFDTGIEMEKGAAIDMMIVEIDLF